MAVPAENGPIVVLVKRQELATLRQQVEALCQHTQAPRVVFDLAPSPTMRGDDLEDLVETAHVVRRAGGVVGLIGVSDYLREVIAILELEREFACLASSLEVASQALEEAAAKRLEVGGIDFVDLEPAPPPKPPPNPKARRSLEEKMNAWRRRRSD